MAGREVVNKQQVTEVMEARYLVEMVGKQPTAEVGLLSLRRLHLHVKIRQEITRTLIVLITDKDRWIMMVPEDTLPKAQAILLELERVGMILE